MMILDKECEKILKKAIDYENTNRSKNQNKLVNIFFFEKICNLQVIDKLANAKHIDILEKKYVDNEMVFHFTLTRDGENYFINKNKQKHKFIFETIKFWLPIAISIAALIVSIIK